MSELPRVRIIKESDITDAMRADSARVWASIDSENEQLAHALQQRLAKAA